VCCAEKGLFRFTVTAHGTAGHASVPTTADNALLKLGPVLSRLAGDGQEYVVSDSAAALLEGLGENSDDAAAALQRIGEQSPQVRAMVEPMFMVTVAPTMARASEKINVIPSRASLKVDCRVPPGLGEDAVRGRIAELLGDLADDLTIEFTERVVGNESPAASPLMDAIDRWIRAADPGAASVPSMLPAFSDSRWFRDAFPDCVAYGFFPQRHMTLFETWPLIHNADERIDVRDLGFAARCYADIARELLG
jgi:acetylornithine deacetylase/succinyl-diaminopimelate desuccinylase-like protein